MTILNRRICTGLLLGFLLLSRSMAAQSGSGDAVKSASASHDVVLTLKITDNRSGLTLEAKKSVPQGSNAFHILQETVAVKYKTYPDQGVFVTALCGVEAGEGMVWTFTVDSKWSTVGIARVTLDQDVAIDWTTR